MSDATEPGQGRTGGPCKARPEDLVERAKEHYLEASDAVCHYNSLIPKALDTWLEVQRERDSTPDKEQTMGGEAWTDEPGKLHTFSNERIADALEERAGVRSDGDAGLMAEAARRLRSTPDGSEPVAWRWKPNDGGTWILTEDPEEAAVLKKHPHFEVQPLYTTEEEGDEG